MKIELIKKGMKTFSAWLACIKNHFPPMHAQPHTRGLPSPTVAFINPCPRLPKDAPCLSMDSLITQQVVPQHMLSRLDFRQCRTQLYSPITMQKATAPSDHYCAHQSCLPPYAKKKHSHKLFQTSLCFSLLAWCVWVRVPKLHVLGSKVGEERKKPD